MWVTPQRLRFDKVDPMLGLIGLALVRIELKFVIHTNKGIIIIPLCQDYEANHTYPSARLDRQPIIPYHLTILLGCPKG